MDKMILIEMAQKRDTDLIEQFCSQEPRMGDGGKMVRVCRMVSFSELLNALHLHDQLLLEALEKEIK